MIVAALVALELVVRTLLVPASKDLSRFRRYPADACTLAKAPGRRIALVGNSTTDAGIDSIALRSLLTTHLGAPQSVATFTADGAGIDLEYWMVERLFSRQEITPDLLVVTFYGRGLEDGERIEVGRLAQFFVAPTDWSELFRFDLPGLEQRADLVLSSAWMTFAVRDRLKERVLDLIPHYQDTMSEVNAANFQHDELLDDTSRTVPTTHRALARFLARQKARAVDVVFVAYPSLPPTAADVAYEISDEARRLIADAGMRILDLRHIGLAPAQYRDRIHVNAAGRVTFTRALADGLASLSRR